MPDVCVRSSVAGVPTAERHRGRQVQRVLHVARGMLRRHVERFEVVIVVFELRPIDHLEAEAREDRFNPLAQDRQRMTMADARGPTGQRDVDRAGRRTCGGCGGEPILQPRVDVGLELVRELAEAWTILGGCRAERLQQA